MNFIKVIGLLVLAAALQACGCTVVDPGNRGVKVHLGEVSPQALPEGLVMHMPLLTNIIEVSVRQQTKKLKSDSYSSDLQQVMQEVEVMYRIPEGNVVMLYQKYQGDPYEALIEPRVQEALKETAAVRTAEELVKKKEQLKADTLKLVKQKLGDLIIVEDIVIANETLSKELEAAIESKMVQQQEAAKAEFTKTKAKIEAETALIKAQGEADAIKVRGAAIRDNPHLVDLQIVERWNGVSPTTVVVGTSGNNVLLPLGSKDK